jgi:hypothetical protein
VTIRNCGAYGSIVNDSVTENVGAFMGLTNTGTNTVIENCLFAGSVSGTNASSVTPFGTWNGASKTLTNSYYINTLGTTDADAVKVTPDQLASGEVAYKLGSAWGQTIGTEDYPVLGGAKVYSVTNCKNEVIYSNTNENIDHNWENGKCTVCGTACEHNFVNSKCTVCGYECTEHNFKNGVCAICGYECTEHSYTNSKCTICGAACTHESYTSGFCTACDAYEPATGSGTEEAPYQIGNAGQLYWFAQKVNGGSTAIHGELTANIVVNENVLNADGTLNGDGSNFRVWTPIGNSSECNYTGTFDGKKFTVSGLYFNDSSVDYVGLFGYVYGGTVKNVGVVDSSFTGRENIGGVVGILSNGTVENCYNTGTVIGIYIIVGGVVGTSNGTVENCYNTGTVIGIDAIVGGVVGSNVGDGTVASCYNTGSVSGGKSGVGGVVGQNWATVENCYYDNTVYSGNAIGFDGGAATKVEGKTTEKFASGEVAYLLGDAFGQTIGEDAYPVLGGEKVYQVCNCKNETAYSNTDADTGHSFGEDGKCTACGALLGDVSGEGRLTALDLALINAYVKEKIAFTPEVLSVADFNRDGFVTSADVDSLKNYILYN